MFVHCVYFYLRPELTAAEIESFEKGLGWLVNLKSVKIGHWGKPASTNRPIIDRSYSYALVVMFENEAAHDDYQEDPQHEAFRQAYHTFWRDIKIYDSIG